MPKKKTAKTDLREAIIHGMLEKKANKVTVLDLRNLKTSMADYFIVCHGSSDKQVNAIADSVEESTLKMAGEKPWHVEGAELSEWILMDYFDVVVHIFREDKREFYGIEELWSDADITEIPEDYFVTAKAPAKPAAKAKAKAPSKARSKSAAAAPEKKSKNSKK